MSGTVRMIPVGHKPITQRQATAWGQVTLSTATARLLREGRIPKGEALTAAKLAGILAAKRVDEIIPLCHTIPLDGVDIDLTVKAHSVQVSATAICRGRTGVEMEALTAVSMACLTIYDMCKSVDREMTIGPIYLIRKSGGRSLLYERKTALLDGARAAPPLSRKKERR